MCRIFRKSKCTEVFVINTISKKVKMSHQRQKFTKLSAFFFQHKLQKQPEDKQKPVSSLKWLLKSFL